jgi:hypothetical protein
MLNINKRGNDMANFHDDLSTEQKEYYKKMYAKLYNNKKEEPIVVEKKEEQEEEIKIQRWSAPKTAIDNGYRPTIKEFNELFGEPKNETL